MKIIGVSFDKPAANAKFKTSNNFAFPLWTDSKRELAVAWGAADSASQLFADRVTVVLDPAGTRILHYNVVFNITSHPQDVLDDCKALVGGM